MVSTARLFPAIRSARSRSLRAAALLSSAAKMALTTAIPAIPDAASSMQLASVMPPMATAGTSTQRQILLSSSLDRGVVSFLVAVANTAPHPR